MAARIQDEGPHCHATAPSGAAIDSKAVRSGSACARTRVAARPYKWACDRRKDTEVFEASPIAFFAVHRDWFLYGRYRIVFEKARQH